MADDDTSSSPARSSAGRRETARTIGSLLRALLTARLSDRFYDGLGDLLGAPSLGPRVGIAVGVCAAATSMLLRFVATPYLGDGEALLTAFPAVLVAALTTGAWGGWTCLALTTVGSWYLFIGDKFTFSFGPYEKGILVGTFLAGAFVIQICRLMRGMFREIAALRAAERLLSRELEHRIKNTLTLVMSIGRQTFRNERSMARALDDFEGRMIALAAAQDLDGRGEHKPADIGEIARRSLAPFCGEAVHERLALSGPDVIVDVDKTVGLFLVFHEFATNSAKYGGLSARAGRVEVAWRLHSASSMQIVLTWIDRDGPPVEPPSREGFGTRLIERIVTRNLRGSIELAYPSSGFRAELVFPV